MDSLSEEKGKVMVANKQSSETPMENKYCVPFKMNNFIHNTVVKQPDTSAKILLRDKFDKQSQLQNKIANDPLQDKSLTSVLNS